MRSNLLRADYAGSRACQPCHRDIYDDFQQAPMNRMTRLPGEVAIRVPFTEEGTVFRFKDDSARLVEHAGQRFVRVESQKFGAHLYRVTKVIGGRHREDFAGVEVGGVEPGAPVIGNPREERVLPVSYLLFSRSLRYKGYSVMVRERPGLRVGGVWNRTCILCHNTSPYFLSILGALAGPGTPAYQGEVVDPLLPEERRFSFEVTDPAGLRRALADEMAVLGGGPAANGALHPEERALLGQAVRTTRARLNQSHLLEIGIGCEACHGGSKEHVQDPRVRPSFAVRSTFLRVRGPTGSEEPSRAQLINRTCARCHQVLFSRYPWTWEGGLRARDPGGSNINSGEARDFLLGACSSRMSCATCHDPHEKDSSARRKQLDTTTGNAICLGCHPRFGGAALGAHTHHDPEGAGSLCLNCHMPRKNMSLDVRLTRYHRIGSPTDRARVLGDRPLECALCHADKSVQAVVADMERLWGKSYDCDALRVLYGDLSANVMLATLGLGKPHEQAVAMAVLGREKERKAVPQLFRQLFNPYPLVRSYAQEALESMLGQSSPVDLNQDDARIQAEAQAWLKGLGFALSTEGNQAPARPAAEDPKESTED